MAAYDHGNMMDAQLMRRDDSAATDESPFGSALTTPADEDSLQLDQLARAFDATVPRILKDDGARTPRVRTLSKAVLRARQFAQGFAKTNKASVSALTLPSGRAAMPEHSPIGSEAATPVSTSACLVPVDTPIKPLEDENSSENAPCYLEPDICLGTIVTLPTPAKPDLNNVVAKEASGGTSEGDLTVDDSPVASPAGDSPAVDPFKVSGSTQSIFSLPNIPISMDAISKISKTITFEGIPLDDCPDFSSLLALVDGLPAQDVLATRSTTQIEPSEDVISCCNACDATDLLVGPPSDLSLAFVKDLRLSDAPYVITKLLFFVPWCAAVGGAILLAPTHLELVAFTLGYGRAPHGVRRFAYWAECAGPHVAMFLALLASVVWCSLTLGLVLTASVATRFCCAWSGFVPDRAASLGADDCQSMYLLAMGFGDDPIGLKKTANGYVMCQPSEDADSDEE